VYGGEDIPKIQVVVIVIADGICFRFDIEELVEVIHIAVIVVIEGKIVGQRRVPEHRVVARRRLKPIHVEVVSIDAQGHIEGGGLGADWVPRGLRHYEQCLCGEDDDLDNLK
jgi:hypothetical protein